MRRNRRKASFHLDIAPVNLIDLLLVLLVFFVTTTTFLQLKVIELNVPSAQNNETQYKKDLTYIVNIKEDCELFFDTKKVDVKDLGRSIKERFTEDKKAIFQVAAHKDSPHHCFVEVLDVFKENKIENISILTKTKDK